MLKCFAFLSLFCFSALKTFAQVPTTDIYLLDMKTRHGKYIFAHPQKISDWNGYNNQPYFTPDGKTIYYVSYRNKQSDIYKYDIRTKTTTQFTNTPEDEYSPKLTPDGKYISVVQVMGDSAQQLWEFPLDGGAAKHIAPGHDSIGYYCWMKNRILTANVPEPMKLILIDTTELSLNGRKIFLDDFVAHNVGRSLQAFGNKDTMKAVFIQKPSDKKDSVNWVCETYNKGAIHKIIQTLPNCEDFAIGPKNILYMGYKSKLYKYQIGKDKDWKEIADFSNTDYKNFYRIAISNKGDRIALVSYQGKKP